MCEEPRQETWHRPMQVNETGAIGEKQNRRKWSSAYQVTVGALEVEHLNGDDLVERLAERAVDDGADALPDLLVQLVVLHVDRVLAPLRSPAAAARLLTRPRHAADPRRIPEPSSEIHRRSIGRAEAPVLRARVPAVDGWRIDDETLVARAARWIGRREGIGGAPVKGRALRGRKELKRGDSTYGGACLKREPDIWMQGQPGFLISNRTAEPPPGADRLDRLAGRFVGKQAHRLADRFDRLAGLVA
nr:unnamed protein product [Digitaria exilis]